METTLCNLCGSEKSRLRYQLTDLLLDRPEVHSQLVECVECGLVYQNPRPTLAEMLAHYPPDYECYDTLPKINPSSWLRRAIRYGMDKRCRVVRRARSHGSLLDVGCASGEFLHAMQQYPGWTLRGVELNDYAAEIARRAYGLDVATGTLEDARFPDCSFDVVTLWDVLEHLHDPLASLKEIQRILKPGGALVARVPNADSWDARLFGPAWAGLEPPRHLYVFGQATLRRAFEKAGLRIKELNCAIGGYPTFVMSVGFWLKTRQTPTQQRQRILRGLSHPIARLVTAPFYWLYSLGLRGPLLIAVAEKL